MFNNHTMTLITNLNQIGPEINNKDFMSVAAVTTSDYPNHPNIFNASILVPPTEILMKWADGYPLVMQNEYPAYLPSKDPDDMIVALLAALTQRNIVIYIPMDEFKIFGIYFMNYMMYTYGIVFNYMNTVFSIDPAKIPFIISKFYLESLMDANDYIASFPSNMMLPPWVINKLADDLKPFDRPATFDEYARYFNQMNASKNQGVLVPMVGVVNNDNIPRQS